MYRYIILALLISFHANLSHAADLGSFLKKSPFKKDQTAKDAKDQGSAQPASL